MAKVSLRVYNREIEGMIEGGQLEEAVGHCQHILKTFPMHIETYRLLGKTFLEARRYGDAADIFQRVLMAVPDDFVSHVGMSIIHDDAGKLDDAIWHMERAFEVQPSNPAIQGELRRLYGRRDGVEPPKIRLSRDALANMYSQGELFNQAIAEIRTVLAEDPNRPDLQVMLARAYLRAGQKVEAAEMAANLLKKYQYCVDALRILVDVLPGTARADNTQVYRQRLRLLDPYSSFVTGSVFGSDQVADAAVNLERLDFRQGTSAAADPGWASTLGIKLAEEKSGEDQPDWLSGVSKNEAPASEDALPELPASVGEEKADENIPDWMRSSGWQESTGTASESPDDQGFAEPNAGEPLAQAEIPDWLQSMKPPEASAPAQAEEETGDFPDWLTNLGTAAAAGAATGFTADGFDTPSSGDTQEAGMPDWLQGADQPAPAAEAPVMPEHPVETPSAPASVTPAAGEDSAFQPSGDAKPLGIEDDTFAWLEGLAAKQGARPDELLTNAEDRKEEMPDWLQGLGEAGSAAEAHVMPEPPVETPSAPAMVTPAAGQDSAFQPSGDDKPLGIEDGTIAWLEGQAAKQGAGPDELLTNAEDRNEEIPDWLQGADQSAPAAEAPDMPEHPVETPSAPASVTPASGQDSAFQPSGDAKPLGIEDDTFAWLEGLAAKQGARPDELLTNAEDRKEEMPDWLQGLGETVPAAETPVEPEPLTETTSAPVDIKPVSSEEVAIQPGDEIKPHSTEDDSLSWLESLSANQDVAPDGLLTEPNLRADSPDELSTILPVEQTLVADTSSVLDAPVEGSPAASEEAQSVADWLSRLDDSSGMPVTPEPGSAAPPEPSQTSTEDLPDWLKGMESSAVAEAEETPPPTDQPAETPPNLPDWLRDSGPSDTPSGEVQQDSAPDPSMPDWISGAGSQPEMEAAVAQPEPEMPAWMDENVPVAQEAAPVMPDEWQPVDEKPAQVIPVAPVQSVVQPPVPHATGMLAPIPNDKDSDLLTRGQSFLEENHLNEAMQQYAKLIKKGRLLDEVIHDLREAIYRFPVDVIVWQTLGDACMRANRLQDALDAYTKAEELLR